MGTIKVSVIIPVYNAEKYLKRTIDSLCKQSLKEMEFIFVDDGSTDGSLNILENAYRNDNRIVIFTKQNGGASSARNVGLEHAKGEYIGFVDSDDEQDFYMFEKMYSEAVSKDIDIVSCGHIEKNGNYEKICYSGNDELISRREAIELLVTNKKIGMSACTKLFKHFMLKNIRFVEGRHNNEDRFFVFEALMNSENILLMHDCFYIYHQNENSFTHNLFSRKKMDALFFADRIFERTIDTYPDLYNTALIEKVKTEFYMLLDLYDEGNLKLPYRAEIVRRIRNTSPILINKECNGKLKMQLLAVWFVEPLFALYWSRFRR
ncbi:MAG: glycosyltransferase family A protein [Blautia sp.]|nr:glycosyltransferase family A protein [Blautia sp.]